MNATNRGKLIAFRGDRLGGRLISLLNTLRIADHYDLPFDVHWRNSDGLDDPTEIFSEAFVRDYFIDKQKFQRLRDQGTPLLAVLASATPEEFLAHLDDNRNIVVDPVFDVQMFPFEDPDEVQKTFSRVVDRLPLNPLLAERLAKVRETIRDDERSVAYHIRRGDLTADRPAMNRAWPNKFVPDEFFESHMRANLDNNARVILFSDNPATLERYKAMFPEINTFESIAETAHLTDVQRDALELFTMASVDQIIAPPASAFSSTAKTIGGIDFADVESCLSEQDRANALNLLTYRLTHQPEKFANDGEVGQYLVYAMNHLIAEGRRAEFISLARAHIETGMNIAFVYADVFREMFLDQQYEQICTLRKRVDDGYVHFSRSFAQVLLFHGAALLMLGRKDEAIRHLTSAFWHEPTEGEIDALIGVLFSQGDLNPGNFWFSDPVVERMFTNRFALEHTQKFFPDALREGVLRIERAIPTCRVMVWEWVDFTRSDLRKKYRYKGHFRAVLKALMRHSWPTEVKPHFDSFIGLINRLEGNTDDAEALLCGAADAKGDVSLFHKRVAELRLEQDRFDDALNAIDKAITLAPDAAMYRALRAVILRRAGDPVAAIAELETVLGTGRLHFPYLYYLAADLQREIGNAPAARDALSEALSLEPMNWRRQLEMAALLIELNENDEAVQILEWTLTWADDHPPMVTTAAQLLNDAGRTNQALALLESAHQKRPEKKQFQRLFKKISREADKRRG